MACFRGEWGPSHPRFAADSPAAVKTIESFENSDYVYNAEDNAAIDASIRGETGYNYPPM